ncbi:MAG: hypothetical protein H5T62_04140 [Anaerolineae bacterium]|nr:hypothetical protein [Anaerolineae bacterium]
MEERRRTVIVVVGISIGLFLLTLLCALVFNLRGRQRTPPPTLPLPTAPIYTDAAALAPTQDDLPQYRLEDDHHLEGAGNVPGARRIAGYECLWSTGDPDTIAYGAYNVTVRIELFEDESATETAYKQRLTEIEEAIVTGEESGLGVAQEIAAPTVGRKATAYQLKGAVQDEQGQTRQVTAYTVVFTQRNGVVMVTTLGYKDYRLLDDAVRLAQSIARRMP